MKKIIILFFNFYSNYKTYFSLVFISLLSFLSIFSLISFFNGNIETIFISIFILIFIINLWLIFLTYPNPKKRNAILSLIASRNKVLNNINLVGAEIGVHRGEYSVQIYNFFKKEKFNLNFFLVDQWIVDDEFKEYGSNNLDVAYKHVQQRFKNNKDIKIMNTSSLNASKDFKDEYFDFVYIDANHDYEFVLQDLKLWFPKLKSKGILFGDDYSRPYGVHQALAEFTHENKLTVHFTDNGNQYYLLKG